MLRNHPLPLLALVLAAALLGPATAQDGAPEIPKPGPEHARFKEWAGTWAYVNKWREGPDGAWNEGTGTETVTVCCGGFWAEIKNEGTMMGMPFEGRELLGYDQAKKKYVATWVDNFGSYLTVMEGTYDEKAKTLTMLAQMPDMSGKMVQTRMVSEIKDADNHVFRIFMPGPDGKEFLMMELTSKRKK